ncbi:hypothetical protein [Microvirga massiliensis]|uniref:hypothetical protein n=1 Tax=Microvirga massiliensis TaxID=1033741 RepID=UPI00062BEEDB|nr:hypothetical protein [Microvirga massiliensis]
MQGRTDHLTVDAAAEALAHLAEQALEGDVGSWVGTFYGRGGSGLLGVRTIAPRLAAIRTQRGRSRMRR